jgi:hypothetical protein
MPDSTAHYPDLETTGMYLMRKVIGLALSCAALAACDRGPEQSTAPMAQAKKDLAGEPFDQVLLRIKQEVGLFQSQSAAWHADIKNRLQKTGITPRCGNGDINFNIRSVKMEFATVLDRKESGEIGLKIPFGPAGANSAGPDFKGSFDTKGTNTLDYTYYVPPSPGEIDQAASSIIAPAAVIAPTLAALRDGLVRATAQLPCMKDTPDDKDNTFTFSVEITRDANPSVGFNFYIVSASAAYDSSRSRSNTITVTFHPTPTGGGLLR